MPTLIDVRIGDCFVFEKGKMVFLVVDMCGEVGGGEQYHLHALGTYRVEKYMTKAHKPVRGILAGHRLYESNYEIKRIDRAGASYHESRNAQRSIAINTFDYDIVQLLTQEPEIWE